VTLDFSSQLHYFWALLPEIVVSVTALAVLLLDVFQRGSRSAPSAPWVGALAVCGVIVAAVANARSRSRATTA
jgi:NADH-quinone oxidoreductase subunit N